MASYQDLIQSNWKTGYLATGMSPSELKRDDFKRVDLKGKGKHYYHSYNDLGLGIEVCLEPCMNGFDVALYRNENLIGNKYCTDLKGNVFKNSDSNVALELHETQERSTEAWDSALKKANDLFRAYKNKIRIERMGLKKHDPLEDEIPDSPGYPYDIPSNSPYGNIPSTPPYYNPGVMPAAITSTAGIMDSRISREKLQDLIDQMRAEEEVKKQLGT